MAERFVRDEEVRGSNPRTPTTLMDSLFRDREVPWALAWYPCPDDGASERLIDAVCCRLSLVIEYVRVPVCGERVTRVPQHLAEGGTVVLHRRVRSVIARCYHRARQE